MFPRLVAAEQPPDFAEHDLPSGNTQLDGLLGGGLPAGTSTLLLGPAGTGKSTIATLFASAAAARGERAAIFAFDENVGTLRSRSRKLGMAIDEPLQRGLITVQQIDPAELSSGEFVAIVRTGLIRDAVRILKGAGWRHRDELVAGLGTVALFACGGGHAAVLRVLPEGLVERADADPVAKGKLSARVQIAQPVLDRIRRPGPLPERFQGAYVENGVVVGEREVQQRRRRRHADALQCRERLQSPALIG